MVSGTRLQSAHSQLVAIASRAAQTLGRSSFGSGRFFGTSAAAADAASATASTAKNPLLVRAICQL